ncbi:hypothetical protein EZV62_022559 [Acer yangbiense]|uniref:Uncharacterized protein n=1 Tax=Acer yangbiense TaxID=1000413 RepID=A0A5C7H8N5_9ROSI|nr:hypothetical protein EZV62_022559 [Acer yangbiense]
MVSLAAFRVSCSLLLNSEYKSCFKVRALSSNSGGDSIVLSADSGACRKLVKDVVSKDLEVLWEDGYGTHSVKDYLDAATEIIKAWAWTGVRPHFAPQISWKCLKVIFRFVSLIPLKAIISDIEMFYRAFEVMCLHIPVHDRTSFEGHVMRARPPCWRFLFPGGILDKQNFVY